MSISTKYFNFIKKLYEQEESGLALALFRIVYGLVVFAEVFQIFYFRHLIFDPMHKSLNSILILKRLKSYSISKYLD